jgi:hypothetical protein
MTVIPATRGSPNKRIIVQARLHKVRPYLKNNQHRVLSSTPAKQNKAKTQNHKKCP